MQNFHDQLELQGLDPDLVLQHQSRIVHFLQGEQKQQVFPIKSAAAKGNGGLLELSAIEGLDTYKNSFTTYATKISSFVPAAGAASRYLDAFAPLTEALKLKDLGAIEEVRESMRVQGFLRYAIPSGLRYFLSEKFAIDLEDSDIIFTDLLASISLPKALMPANLFNLSFLELKYLEFASLGLSTAQIYVVPTEYKPHFEFFNRTYPDQVLRKASVFSEQGPSLSTVRFNSAGMPVFEADSSLSIVPAGHGALIEIVPKIAREFKDLDTIFIRNIDNVIGIDAPAVSASQDFLALHRLLLESIKSIRADLENDDIKLAQFHSFALLQNVFAIYREKSFEEMTSSVEFSSPYARLNTTCPKDGVFLVKVLVDIFHTPPGLLEDLSIKSLLALLSRPVNLMGMVKNTGKDVGGIPVWVDTELGLTKICLELPHISAEDRSFYFSNPEHATHFNPSFVAAEIFADAKSMRDAGKSFWLLAQKRFRGQNVLYHETILYELLGNSIASNLVFVEIPRFLFNPNKVIADTEKNNLVLIPR